MSLSVLRKNIPLLPCPLHDKHTLSNKSIPFLKADGILHWSPTIFCCWRSSNLFLLSYLISDETSAVPLMNTYNHEQCCSLQCGRRKWSAVWITRAKQESRWARRAKLLRQCLISITGQRALTFCTSWSHQQPTEGYQRFRRCIQEDHTTSWPSPQDHPSNRVTADRAEGVAQKSEWDHSDRQFLKPWVRMMLRLTFFLELCPTMYQTPHAGP